VAPAELARRARAAARVVACNRDVADELRPTGAAVDLIPHGVDLRRFRAAAPPAPEPLRLLAVGRLVEKKGFEVLIEAVSGLTVPFRLRLVGDGPLRARLERAVAAAGAGDRIELLGPRTHDELPGEYAGAHAVVVPSVEDSTGDRDGLPNVVLEAMASGRAVVASAIAGIPSAVRDGDTGLLVPPGDPFALRAALERLAGDPSLRARVGAAARARVERDFDLQSCAARLRRCLEGAYA
jgi:glycosyltransferase involved in cell wall biosynthesis